MVWPDGRGAGQHSLGFRFLSKNAEAWAAPELERIHGDSCSKAAVCPNPRLVIAAQSRLSRQTGARLFELRAESGCTSYPRWQTESPPNADRFFHRTVSERLALHSRR